MKTQITKLPVVTAALTFLKPDEMNIFSKIPACTTIHGQGKAKKY